MKTRNFKAATFAAILAATLSLPAHASVPTLIISEVDANGSSASYGGDWFELTNISNTAISISGWKMDDNSNLYANAVALRGVTSIAAGQSIIFIEGNTSGTTDATINANFKTAWFGNNVPANLTIGNYGGSGVGLSGSGDAVNIFDSSGSLITSVDFGISTSGKTFDNAAGITTISQLSAVGVNGAFLSANGAEIGSPGAIAAVPEPETYALMLIGLGLTAAVARRKQCSIGLIG
jgi:hypothetical protein